MPRRLSDWGRVMRKVGQWALIMQGTCYSKIADIWSFSFNWPAASHKPGDSGEEKRGWASLHLMEAQARLFLSHSGIWQALLYFRKRCRMTGIILPPKSISSVGTLGGSLWRTCG